MSALSGFPRRADPSEHSISRIVSESFWTLVALALGLVAFFVVAGGSAVMTTEVIGFALGLFALWAIHSRSVRRHAVEAHQDERWRRARERRGF